MYNTDAMGVRIRGYGVRKSLAGGIKTLGIGSGGEQVGFGLGFPDISLLPMIAETLGTKVRRCRRRADSAAGLKIYITARRRRNCVSETAWNLHRPLLWNGAYADADPVRIDGAVTFSDGSTADLAGEIVNSGVRVDRVCG